jgi:hypothetical protein
MIEELLSSLKAFRNNNESTVKIPDIVYHFTSVNKAWRILTDDKLRKGNTIHGNDTVSVVSVTSDPNYYKVQTRGVYTDIRFTLDGKAINKDFGLFPHIDPNHTGEDEFCCSSNINNLTKYFKAITVIKKVEFINNPTLKEFLDKRRIPFTYI